MSDSTATPWWARVGRALAPRVDLTAAKNVVSGVLSEIRQFLLVTDIDDRDLKEASTVNRQFRERWLETVADLAREPDPTMDKKEAADLVEDYKSYVAVSELESAHRCVSTYYDRTLTLRFDQLNRRAEALIAPFKNRVAAELASGKVNERDLMRYNILIRVEEDEATRQANAQAKLKAATAGLSREVAELHEELAKKDERAQALEQELSRLRYQLYTATNSAPAPLPDDSRRKSER